MNSSIRCRDCLAPDANGISGTEISHISLKLVAYTTNNSLIIGVADNGHGNSREFAYNGDGNYQAAHIMAMVIHANTELLKP